MLTCRMPNLDFPEARLWNTMGTSTTRKDSPPRARISRAILNPAVSLANSSNSSRRTAKNPDNGSFTPTSGATSIVAARETNHLIQGQSTIEPPRTYRLASAISCVPSNNGRISCGMSSGGWLRSASSTTMTLPHAVSAAAIMSPARPLFASDWTNRTGRSPPVQRLTCACVSSVDPPSTISTSASNPFVSIVDNMRLRIGSILSASFSVGTRIETVGSRR